MRVPSNRTHGGRLARVRFALALLPDADTSASCVRLSATLCEGRESRVRRTASALARVTSKAGARLALGTIGGNGVWTRTRFE